MQAWSDGFVGLGLSVVGGLAALAILIGPFAARMLGGGDVKLAMVCGVLGTVRWYLASYEEDARAWRPEGAPLPELTEDDRSFEIAGKTLRIRFNRSIAKMCQPLLARSNRSLMPTRQLRPL